ncbi:MAG TPA: glucose-1-phosphate adenylyltransferase [Rhodocyclaceae bacterium]
MPYPKILAMVMAGGEGSRLYPLTVQRSKPSVPFGGRYRIVDFVISNLVNSGIYAIYLLVQYKSQSLIEHVNHAWAFSHILPDQFVTVVPPQMREGPEWFQGTADAVRQNRNLIAIHRPDLVAVFGADHIYRMDLRQMVRFHRDQRAQVSVAALPVPVASAHEFGIITADGAGRVTDFKEKPAQPAPMPDRPDYAYASMGNYLFDTELLLEALEETERRGESDFGRHMLPRLIADGRCRVCAYNFSQNQVPGVRAYEDAAYWRDVGTVDAYFAANMDTLGAEPRFNAFNPRWPITSSNYQGPSARFADARVKNSLVGDGTMVKGATIRNSIVRREVMIEEDVHIDSSIVMDYVVIRKGARLHRVIVDRFNEIPAGMRIGYDRAADEQAGFHVTPSGIAVIARGNAGRTGFYDQRSWP